MYLDGEAQKGRLHTIPQRSTHFFFLSFHLSAFRVRQMVKKAQRDRNMALVLISQDFKNIWHLYKF
jgi:hypothetical protein